MESKFENRIREIREQKKMTLKQIAEQVEISVPYLSDIERGNRRGSSATIGRIAEALGVNPGDLLKRAG